MTRAASIAILLISPGALLAAPTADATSITALWKINGDVMGSQVSMMCEVTETSHKLTGNCSGGQDGYQAHKIAGTVKGEKVEFYFQTSIGGGSITMIVNAKLNEDRTGMDGTLDVEPLGVGGPFKAVRELDPRSLPASATAGAPPAEATSSPAQPATSALSTAGSGKSMPTSGTPK